MSQKTDWKKILEDLDEIHVEQKQVVMDTVARAKKRLGSNLEDASFVKVKHDGETIKSDIFVTMSASGEAYEFVLDDCTLINGRWYNMDGIR